MSFIAHICADRLVKSHSGLVDTCGQAVIEILQAGIVPMGAIKSFEVPTCKPTQDLEEVTEWNVTGYRVIQEIFEKHVAHLATPKRWQRNSANQSTCTFWYADMENDWPADAWRHFSACSRNRCRG